jgi:hypothetical protein
MKLRNTMLGMVVVIAAANAGCAVCDTCDDFPVPCVGANCGQNVQGGPAVMGSATQAYPDDSAATGPMMPPAAQ